MCNTLTVSVMFASGETWIPSRSCSQKVELPLAMKHRGEQREVPTRPNCSRWNGACDKCHPQFTNHPVAPGMALQGEARISWKPSELSGRCMGKTGSSWFSCCCSPRLLLVKDTLVNQDNPYEATILPQQARLCKKAPCKECSQSPSTFTWFCDSLGTFLPIQQEVTSWLEATSTLFNNGMVLLTEMGVDLYHLWAGWWKRKGNLVF